MTRAKTTSGNTEPTIDVHLVWNAAKSECVGFLDKCDADYTATGKMSFLEHRWATPTIGEAFRESYGEDARRLPQTTISLVIA